MNFQCESLIPWTSTTRIVFDFRYVVHTEAVNITLFEFFSIWLKILESKEEASTSSFNIKRFVIFFLEAFNEHEVLVEVEPTIFSHCDEQVSILAFLIFEDFSSCFLDRTIVYVLRTSLRQKSKLRKLENGSIMTYLVFDEFNFKELQVFGVFVLKNDERHIIATHILQAVD